MPDTEKVTAFSPSAATGDGQSPSQMSKFIINDNPPESNDDFETMADKEHPG